MMKEISLYTCAWATSLLFVVLLSETIISQSNIFCSVPASLAVAMNFVKVIFPPHFFTKLFGAATILVAVFTIIANLNNRTALKYILAFFILVALFEFLFLTFCLL